MSTLPSDPQVSKQMTDDERYKLWQKYEEVAMHFNDLVLRLRVQALGGITAVFALSGIAVNFAAGPIRAEQWDVIFGTLLFLIAAWIAIAVLDLCYYHTLLLGAVDALLEVEENSAIILSTRIEQRFHRSRPRNDDERRELKRWVSERRWSLVFYAIGLLTLLAAAVTTKCVASNLKGAEPSSIGELRGNEDQIGSEKQETTVGLKGGTSSPKGKAAASGINNSYLASILIALVVPFLSVYAAQSLVRQDAKRQATRDIFLKINKDIQDFRHVFLDRHPDKLTAANVTQDTVAQLSRDLVDAVTQLNGDCLMLGLIFDKQADDLGRRLQAFGGRAEVLLGDAPPPPIVTCQEGLNKEIQEIAQEMRPLWESLFLPGLRIWKRTKRKEAT